MNRETFERALAMILIARQKTIDGFSLNLETFEMLANSCDHPLFCQIGHGFIERARQSSPTGDSLVPAELVLEWIDTLLERFMAEGMSILREQSPENVQ